MVCTGKGWGRQGRSARAPEAVNLRRQHPTPLLPPLGHQGRFGVICRASKPLRRVYGEQLPLRRRPQPREAGRRTCGGSWSGRGSESGTCNGREGSSEGTVRVR